MGVHFLPEGYNVFIIVFIINYSGISHHFPTQLREVAAAMDLIYKNADKWHCDTEKIAMLGFSAGAHLVAHYSNKYDCEEVRKVFPCSYPVQAAVLGYPVITALPDLCNRDSIVRV